MSKAKDEYNMAIFEPRMQWLRKIVRAYVTELELEKAELKDQVESIMNLISILIDEDLVKDEGILLLDKIVKEHMTK